MERQHSPQTASQTAGGFVVEAPRACDAIGNALRNAFKGNRTLPDEFASALLKLDRVC